MQNRPGKSILTDEEEKRQELFNQILNLRYYPEAWNQGLQTKNRSG